MAKAKTVAALIAAGEFVVEHGDYQRIAHYALKPDGTPYTADYVRKVLKGMRKNEEVEEVARTYFKRKTKLQKDLASYRDTP